MNTISFSKRGDLDGFLEDFTSSQTFGNSDKPASEYHIRGKGHSSTDIPLFGDATTSRYKQGQSSAHQDPNIDTTALISQYRNSVNLIGTELARGPSLKKRNANRNTHTSTPILPPFSQRSSMSAEITSGTIIGIVMYDFKAEGSNELDAKAGDAITVVAQSHPEWFVARLSDQLDSLGLIPVSFVEIRDIATGTIVENSQDAIKRAGVPRVEEWIKTVGNEDSSIALGKPSGHASDSGTLFRVCVPTKERLMNLRNGWTNVKSLDSRLLYCQPFSIVFLEQGKLVMKSHNDMIDLVEQQEGKLGPFFDQVEKEWPESFGQLDDAVDAPASFRWHPAGRSLDDGTVFLCRVAAKIGERQPLGALISPGTFTVCQYPADNMLWQIMPKISNSVLTMRTVAFLESLFAPTHDTSNLPSYGSLNDWFPIQMTTPVLRSTGNFGVGDWYCVQINLRACIPDNRGHRSKHFQRAWGISPKRVGLPLNRQTAQIPDLSQGCSTTAIEYLLSVSMVLRKKTPANSSSVLKYDIVAWVDYDTNFQKTRDRENIFPVLTLRVDLDLGLEDCGSGGEAVLQFIMVLARSIDHWKSCWDGMIDRVDDIINVQLQDTLDKKRWNSLMFDDSLQLSEQYFTILQLLRICQNWIGEAERGIKNLGDELIQKCDSWKAWQHEQAQNDLSQWSIDMTKLKHNIKRLQEFFETRASPLRERIKIKRDEVASLQDALLSTSSLRETLKAKTLNLYIGVFTTVTVFFTPLGFIATLWTIPFLQPNLENPTPKGFTESFVAVPILTYILSGSIILYFCVKPSGRRRIMYGLSMAVVWAICPIWVIGNVLIYRLSVLIQYLFCRNKRDSSSMV